MHKQCFTNMPTCIKLTWKYIRSHQSPSNTTKILQKFIQSWKMHDSIIFPSTPPKYGRIGQAKDGWSRFWWARGSPGHPGPEDLDVDHRNGLGGQKKYQIHKIYIWWSMGVLITGGIDQYGYWSEGHWLVGGIDRRRKTENFRKFLIFSRLKIQQIFVARALRGACNWFFGKITPKVNFWGPQKSINFWKIYFLGQFWEFRCFFAFFGALLYLCAQNFGFVAFWDVGALFCTFWNFTLHFAFRAGPKKTRPWVLEKT